MKSDAIAFGIAGVMFGLIAGWVIGSQQAAARPPSAAAQTASSAPASGASGTTRAAVLDENQVTALKSVAGRELSNPAPRTQLGNLYFDAERYDEAIKWYAEALKLAPDDVNVSTDLGVCYYYSNQPDKALEQFSHSLKLDPKHAKTLLNVGIVKAFGKQDLEGASDAWQQVIKIAPDAPEGQAAKRALDSLKFSASGHRWRADARCVMLRIALLLILMVVLGRTFWRIIDGLVEGITGRPRTGVQRGAPQQGVSMVRDPVCGTFVLPERAVSLADGRTRLFFCSDTCRDKYRARPA